MVCVCTCMHASSHFNFWISWYLFVKLGMDIIPLDAIPVSFQFPAIINLNMADSRLVGITVTPYIELYWGAWFRSHSRHQLPWLIFSCFTLVPPGKRWNSISIMPWWLSSKACVTKGSFCWIFNVHYTSHSMIKFYTPLTHWDVEWETM